MPGLVSGIVLLVLGLVVIIAWEARVFLYARRTNAAVARLHTRIVGLFSLIAILPTVLLAVVAAVTIDRGLSLGFTDRVRDVVLKSVEVADAYQENQCQSLAREIRILGDDLTRARPNFDVNRAWFESFLTTRATALGLPVAEIMRGPTDVVARANIDVLKRAGVTDLVSLSACGSFKAELHPGLFVLVDQFVDRTHGRAGSFFGDGCVAHVSLAHPVGPTLQARIAAAAQRLRD